MTEVEAAIHPGELAHAALDGLMDAMARPEWRAGLAVSVLTAAMLARSGVRFPPTLALALLAGGAAEHAYGMLMDIHAAATGDTPAV